MHHLLLFLPILALGLFIILPWPLALALYLVILIGSIVAYWKALQALRQPQVMGRSTMIGDLAVVVRAEKDEVQVEYKGEIWSAVSGAWTEGNHREGGCADFAGSFVIPISGKRGHLMEGGCL
jgi:membrane protein implicated in regulation of membrane protease activity